MLEENIMLDTIYENWEKYQNGLIEALAPLTPEQLALRGAPNLRSIGELATHIVGARAGWFNRGLQEGSPDLARIAEWQRQDTTRTAGELVEGLRTTWSAIMEAIGRWTPEDLAAQIQREWRGEVRTVNRPWVIWHLLEHDLHHGGELGYSLGMHGLAAPEI